MYVLFFLVLGLMFIFVARRYNKKSVLLKKSHNIVDGKVSYQDLNVPAVALFSKRYMIAGKPDYIVEQNGRFIPVELKTGNVVEPRENHVFQLAAYCQLVEENYGDFVPYGMLVYGDSKSFRIPFNPQVRFELENTLSRMRNSLRTDSVVRNHNDPGRCLSCSMRKFCNMKIK